MTKSNARYQAASLPYDEATSDDSTWRGHLEAHVRRNGRYLVARFPEHGACSEERLFFEDLENKKKPLHGSDVDNYKCNIPQLTRTGTADSIIDMVSSVDMGQFLEQFDSLVPFDKFVEVWDEIVESFCNIFSLTDTGVLKVSSEEHLRGKLISWMSVVARLVGGKEYFLPDIKPDELCGSAGQLCHVLNLEQAIPVIDVNAGLLHFSDLVIRFGHPKYMGKTFAIFELKINHSDDPKRPPALDPIWYRNGKAMCSQVYAGSIGEDAPLSIGMMPEGYKGIIRRQSADNTRLSSGCEKMIEAGPAQVADDDQKPVLCDEKPEHPATPQHDPLFRFGWFPAGDGLADYASAYNLNFFCFLLAHIVRIGMTPRNHFKPELFSIFSSEVTCLSPERKKQRRPPTDPPSASKTNAKFDSEYAAASKRKDKVITMVANDGSLTQFVSLDVKARLSPKQIQTEYEIHRRRKNCEGAAFEE
jgi:hypothetical protein